MATPGETSPTSAYREESVAAASISDQAANIDSLGFEPYVAAIAEFLTNPETKPPLTLSVEGEWGSGKSSFMQQLQIAIENRTQEQNREKLIKEREGCRNNIKRLDNDFKERASKLFEVNWQLIRRKLPNSSFQSVIKILLLGLILIVLFPVLCLLLVIRVLGAWLRYVWLSIRIRWIGKPKVVWFNAWRHDKAEALWAAFALTFLEKISKKCHFCDVVSPAIGHLKLLWSRFEKSASSLIDLSRTLSQLLLFVSAIVLVLIFTFLKSYGWVERLETRVSTIAANLTEVEANCIDQGIGSTANEALIAGQDLLNQSQSLLSETSSSLTASPPLTASDVELCPTVIRPDESSFLVAMVQQLSVFGGVLGAGGLTTLWLLQKLQKAIGDPKKELTDYLKSPDYASQVSFIEQFHVDFKKIVDAYAGKGNKVYVFIDDLDRCDVPKSAELMQAINLMIANDPQLIFILGMDREKVAAGLAVKHQEVIPYLSSAKLNHQGHDSDEKLQGIEYGYAFIEKFVQLPFLLPQPSPADFEGFLNKLTPTAEPKLSFWNRIWAFSTQLFQPTGIVGG